MSWFRERKVARRGGTNAIVQDAWSEKKGAADCTEIFPRGLGSFSGEIFFAADDQLNAFTARRLAQPVIEWSVAKLLGFILLIAGAVLLYFGWEAHTATPPQLVETLGDPRPEQSIWLLVLGAVALVWGLFVLLRRRVM